VPAVDGIPELPTGAGGADAQHQPPASGIAHLIPRGTQAGVAAGPLDDGGCDGDGHWDDPLISGAGWDDIGTTGRRYGTPSLIKRTPDPALIHETPTRPSFRFRVPEGNEIPARHRIPTPAAARSNRAGIATAPLKSLEPPQGRTG